MSSPSLTALGALLAHREPPRTTFWIDRQTPVGSLRLDIDDIKVLGDRAGELNEAQLADAEARWQAARASYVPGHHEASEAGMRAIVRDYPLWPKGHGALYDLHKFLGNLPEAEYHFRQLIALVPSYDYALDLAELLGGAGQLEPAMTLFDELWKLRTFGSEDLVQRLVHGRLVTIGRLHDGARMTAIAREALDLFGEVASVRYQYLLGLILMERRDEARDGCRAALAALPQDEPLRPRFEQMLTQLGG